MSNAQVHLRLSLQTKCIPFIGRRHQKGLLLKIIDKVLDIGLKQEIGNQIWWLKCVLIIYGHGRMLLRASSSKSSWYVVLGGTVAYRNKLNISPWRGSNQKILLFAGISMTDIQLSL